MTNIDLSNNPLLNTVRLTNTTLTELDIRNGNNTNILNENFDISDNPDLICVFVDDATWSTDNWTNIDTTSHFVETQAECDAWTGVNEKLQDQFSIYPNPVNDSFSIVTDISYKKIEIYNQLGQKVAVFHNKNNYSLAELPSGIYYINILSKNNILTRKIIKI